MPSSPIRTDRLILRCWDPADAARLKAAVDKSLDHLRPWMPWALEEPSELSVVAARLQGFRSKFLSGEDYVYAILDASDTEVVGGTGLHPRIGPGAYEIGYWIRVDLVGRGFAREAARAMTRVGFEELRAHRLEIRCDPANHASAAIPRRLGYTLKQVLERNTRTPAGEPRDTMVWELTAEQYERSPSLGLHVR